MVPAFVLAVSARGRAAAAEDERYPRFSGYRGQVVYIAPERPVAPAALLDLDGRATDLTVFRGKTVVLNFWAPWCEPCIREMPSLDRLASSLDPARYAVVAVAINGVSAEAARAFADRLGVRRLVLLRDASGLTASMFLGPERRSQFFLYGLPITYFIGSGGQVMGYLVGSADWDGAPVLRFLERLSAR